MCPPKASQIVWWKLNSKLFSLHFSHGQNSDASYRHRWAYIRKRYVPNTYIMWFAFGEKEKLWILVCAYAQYILGSVCAGCTRMCWHHVTVLSFAPALVFDIRSLSEPEPHWFARLTGRRPSGNNLCLPPPNHVFRSTGICYWKWTFTWVLEQAQLLTHPQHFSSYVFPAST